MSPFQLALLEVLMYFALFCALIYFMVKSAEKLGTTRHKVEEVTTSELQLCTNCSFCEKYGNHSLCYNASLVGTNYATGKPFTKACSAVRTTHTCSGYAERII